MSSFIEKTLLAVAVLCALLPSCKKESTASVQYLSGSIYVSCPEYVGGDTILTFKNPTTVINPSGRGYGLGWVVTPGMSKYDTVRTESSDAEKTFSFYVVDTTASYVITCAAWASGYYSISGSATTTVVKGGIDEDASIQFSDDSYVLDDVDTVFCEGEIWYRAVKLQGKWWMQRNVSNDSCGVAYNKYAVTSDVFGRWYTAKQAAKVCPDGWRLPTLDEWAEAVGGTANRETGFIEGANSGSLLAFCKMNGTEVFEFWPQVKMDKSTRIGVFPFGYATVPSNFNYAYGTMAALWSADTSADGNNGIYIYMYADKAPIYIGYGDADSFGANVRCVK